MPNKFVFPGGAVDRADGAVPLAAPLPALCHRRLAEEAPDGLQHALAAAAIRELGEETGLILGRPGSWASPPPADWETFAATGHIPDASALRFVFRAITPPGRPRRVDALRLGAVSSIPTAQDVLGPDEDVYELPAVARLLGIPVSKVAQQLRDGHLVAVRRDGAIVVPKVFFDDDGHVVKSLPGLLMVLHDGGYEETEIVRWLFTPDPSLTISRDGSTERQANARPVDALHSHQAREVVRRAQAMAY